MRIRAARRPDVVGFQKRLVAGVSLIPPAAISVLIPLPIPALLTARPATALALLVTTPLIPVPALIPPVAAGVAASVVAPAATLVACVAVPVGTAAVRGMTAPPALAESELRELFEAPRLAAAVVLRDRRARARASGYRFEAQPCHDDQPGDSGQA
jgi:hypothetical protein